MSNMPVNPPSWRNDTVLPLPNEVTANAWAVDAACSGNPGPMEYQCIDLQTGAQVFHYGPIHGTNNIGEFLAIVHALALMAQKGITGKVIYSEAMQDQVASHSSDRAALSGHCPCRKLAPHPSCYRTYHEMGYKEMGRDSCRFRKKRIKTQSQIHSSPFTFHA